MESANLEMVKRLKYTKDILTHMLNANAANLNSKPTDANPIGGIDPTGPTGQPPQAQTGRPQTTSSNALQGGMPRTQATERINSRPYSGKGEGANF